VNWRTDDFFGATHQSACAFLYGPRLLSLAFFRARGYLNVETPEATLLNANSQRVHFRGFELIAACEVPKLSA
jgi:hypothetical protein